MQMKTLVTICSLLTACGGKGSSDSPAPSPDQIPTATPGKEPRQDLNAQNFKACVLKALDGTHAKLAVFLEKAEACGLSRGQLSKAAFVSLMTSDFQIRGNGKEGMVESK